MSGFGRTGFLLTCVVFLLVTPAVAQDQAAALLGSAASDQVYTAVTPCRFVDGINAADRVSTTANSTTARYYRVRGATGADFVSQGPPAARPRAAGFPPAPPP